MLLFQRYEFCPKNGFPFPPWSCCHLYQFWGQIRQKFYQNSLSYISTVSQHKYSYWWIQKYFQILLLQDLWWDQKPGLGSGPGHSGHSTYYVTIHHITLVTLSSMILPTWYIAIHVLLCYNWYQAWQLYFLYSITWLNISYPQ